MSNLKVTLTHPITFHPQLARVFGSIEAAIIIQQLSYWQERSSRKDGFVYKSQQDWEEETTITRRPLERVTKELKKLGFLEIQKLKANGAPTNHYRLNIEMIQEAIDHNDKSICTKRTNPNEQNVQNQELYKTYKSITETTRDYLQVEKVFSEECSHLQSIGAELTHLQADALVQMYPESAVVKTLRAVEDFYKANPKLRLKVSLDTTIKQWLERSKEKKRTKPVHRPEGPTGDLAEYLTPENEIVAPHAFQIRPRWEKARQKWSKPKSPEPPQLYDPKKCTPQEQQSSSPVQTLNEQSKNLNSKDTSTPKTENSSEQSSNTPKQSKN